jgi:hypothetical protein
MGSAGPPCAVSVSDCLLELARLQERQLVALRPYVQTVRSQALCCPRASTRSERTSHSFSLSLSARISLPSALPQGPPTARPVAAPQQGARCWSPAGLARHSFTEGLALCNSVGLAHCLPAGFDFEASTSAGVFGLAPAEPFTTSPASLPGLLRPTASHRFHRSAFGARSTEEGSPRYPSTMSPLKVAVIGAGGVGSRLGKQLSRQACVQRCTVGRPGRIKPDPVLLTI